MNALSVPHPVGRAAFLAALASFVEVVAALDDHRLLGASRCHGWSALEVVVHVRTGLQEMTGGVVAVGAGEPDRDAASYWAGFPPSGDAGADDVDAILWTRRTASAYRRPRGAVEHLRMAADTVSTAVAAMPDDAVSFQGHALRSGDFLATWAVELAVHHLDLLVEEPPPAQALRLGRATVEALAGAALPAGWSDELCLLAGTGRVTAPESATRGLPVLG